MIGALCATIGFIIAKSCFAWYVTHFPTYEVIYGTLASIPIFILWIYLSWFIIIIGVAIAKELTRKSYLLNSTTTLTSFEQAYLLLYKLWLGQKNGKACKWSDFSLIESGETDLDMLLYHLLKNNLIAQTKDQTWLLTVNLENMTLFQLQRQIGYTLPNHISLKNKSESIQAFKELVPALEKLDSLEEKTLDINIANIFEQSSKQKNPA